MTTQQQQPDGSWAPAQPLGYQSGYDIERYGGGRWVLYRTHAHHLPGRHGGSTEVARGRTTLGMLFAYFWRRLLRPVR